MGSWQLRLELEDDSTSPVFRQIALCDALRSELPRLTFNPPRGGMAVWARALGVDVYGWAERAMAQGVAFQTARRFAFDGQPRDYVRLGFAACNERELAEAARRQAAALLDLA